MARPSNAAACLCTVFFLVQSASAVYVAINCGGNTTADPSLPTYYDGVTYGPGPIYDPKNEFAWVNKNQKTNPPTTFVTDRYYYGSSNHVTDWSVGHGTLNDTTNINVTNAYNGDDYIFITERYGLDLAYAINLPNGNYTVDFLAAESLYSGSNQRVFDILYQGKVAYSYFDPFAWAGAKNKAVTASTQNVTVSNGLLLITLVPRIYEPSVRGIRVYDDDQFTALPTPPTARSINCGGGEYRSADGTVWEGDKFFTTDAGPITVLQFINSNASAPANVTSRVGRNLLQANATVANATLPPPTNGTLLNATVPNATVAVAANNTLPDNSTLAANTTPDNTTVEIQQLYPVPVTYKGPDAQLYLTGRTENDFQYLINVPNGDYVVELHLCEFVFSKPLQRIFTVKVNHVPAVTQLDLVAAVGYNVPLVVKLPVTVTNGLLKLEFVGDVLFGSLKSNATVSGIRYYPNVNATSNFSLGIDSGSVMDVLSGLGIVYKADTYYNANDSRVVALNPQSKTGSYPPYQVFLPIGTGIDDFIYATALQGPVSYNIPVPNGQYAVDLQFAEIEPGVGSGQRVFNVNLQGALAIANLDIFNQSGGNRTALLIQKEVVVTAGTLKIDLVPVVGQPLISGLFIHPGLATATGNLTVAKIPKLPALTAPAPGPAQAIPQQPFPIPPGGFSYAVVCGDFKDYNSSFGVTFHADTVQCDPGNVVPANSPYCRTNIKGPQGGYAFCLNDTFPISQTNDPQIFRCERIGFNTYKFRVPPGLYQADAFFAEISYGPQPAGGPGLVTGDGQRTFNLNYNGDWLVLSYDPFKEAGHQKYAAAPVVTNYIQVGLEGILSLQLYPTGVPQAPKISAIWVHQIA